MAEITETYWKYSMGKWNHITNIRDANPRAVTKSYVDGMKENNSSGRFLEGIKVNGTITFIIADIVFWCDHEEEILVWLDNNTEEGASVHHGMTLTFNNEEDALWFKLKWDGK